MEKDSNFADILCLKARYYYDINDMENAQDYYHTVYDLIDDDNSIIDDRIVETFHGMIKVAKKKENYDLANLNLGEFIRRLMLKDFSNSKYNKEMIIDL